MIPKQISQISWSCKSLASHNIFRKREQAKCEHINQIIIQHIDTLPKYGQKTRDVRRSTWRISNDKCKF